MRRRTFLFTAKGKQPILAEKAEGDATFQSVFDPAKVTKTSGPRLPGREPIEEPKFDKGQEYAVAPAKDVKPVPKGTAATRFVLRAAADRKDFRIFREHRKNDLAKRQRRETKEGECHDRVAGRDPRRATRFVQPICAKLLCYERRTRNAESVSREKTNRLDADERLVCRHRCLAEARRHERISQIPQVI